MQIKGATFFSMVFRIALFRSVVLCLAPQQFVVLHEAPVMIWYSISALSFCSSVAPGPLVSVLIYFDFLGFFLQIIVIILTLSVTKSWNFALCQSD